MAASSPAAPAAAGARRGPAGVGTKAMVCGIVGVTLLPTVYGMILSVLLGPAAVALGLVARGRARREGVSAGRNAVIGIATGAVAFAVAAAVIVLALTGVVFSGDEEDEKPADRRQGPSVQVMEDRSGTLPWAGDTAG
ncbi:hypothetical protein O7599_09510 [Streptomyces sp. WMMC500]|uniref:hypothetical protein n=1 Tax=Streptomyces sp. WMMC500 TaxID=3015154 RepID=UPI00248ADC44|nr:hypothetical protein [Streptomyces sp. WMMC500]WBB62744.1 hypothetical protein O7599_09510 [Streptomyces sp. WMMC500]